LKERSTYRELDCFLEAGDRDNFEEKILVNKAAEDGFALFWEAMARPEVKAFPCF